ncbi:DUF6350 family protein, partial [Streptomyces sp. NPDC006265]|uniref:cell division protein PerM n=1 Tax=Streptomyces sp. NPDC006265 TaxID=3156740 RepID=UPI0033AF90A9
RTVRAAALASVLCAAVLAVLAGLSGGPLGADVLSRFGPVWWQAAAATLVWLGLLAIPTAVGVRAWRCRSPRAEEPKIGNQREDAAPGADGAGRLWKSARLGRGRFTRSGVAGIAGVAGSAGAADGPRGAGRADGTRGAGSSVGDEDAEGFWGAGVLDDTRGAGDADGSRGAGRAAGTRDAERSGGDEDAAIFWGAGDPATAWGVGRHAPHEPFEHDALYGLRDQNRDPESGLYDFLPSDPAPSDRSAPPESP